MQFASFFHQLGLWYEDTYFAQLIVSHFEKEYYAYSCYDLCLLVKLLGHSKLQTGSELRSFIADILKMHLQEGREVDLESLSHLLEGASIS